MENLLHERAYSLDHFAVDNDTKKEKEAANNILREASKLTNKRNEVEEKAVR
jgi:hypothetical protein